VSDEGPDYARLIEQVRSGKILPKNWSGSEESQKAVSEGSFWPKTWREAVPLVVWGVLVFACGFELVSSTVHSELWPAIYSGIGLVVLLAMLIHGNTFVERLNDLGARWLVVAVIVLLLVSALSPYVEQRRWPFAWQFDGAPAPPSQIGFTQEQVDQKIAAAIAATRTGSTPVSASPTKKEIRKYPPTDRDALLPALRRADDAADEFRHIVGAEQSELGTLRAGGSTPPAETLLSNFRAFLEKASKQQLKIANQFDGLRSYHQELEGLDLLNPDESYGDAVDEYFHFLSFFAGNHTQPDAALLSFQVERLLKEVTGYAAKISNYQGALDAKIKEIKDNPL
jgi:hypothetical protein